MTFEEFQRLKVLRGESKSSTEELNNAVTLEISSVEGDF